MDNHPIVFRVLCGTFYYELEHSLNHFEICHYITYNEALRESLKKALLNFTDIDDNDVRDQINHDLEQRIENTANKTIFYANKYKEYHIKIERVVNVNCI